ncbi:hypothetical protein BGX26_005548 [Mortierella sp. AD094]|nr:hypothetical protein BGX26_005548 [Mortierella sp. AD094]
MRISVLPIYLYISIPSHIAIIIQRITSSMTDRIYINNKGSKSVAHCALEIPEILAQVLVQLDQETLLKSTRLVSHSWYRSSHVFIVREVVWSENITDQSSLSEGQDDSPVKNLKDWISRLSQATALLCQSDTDACQLDSLSPGEQEQNWEDLGAMIIASQQDMSQQPDQVLDGGHLAVTGHSRFPQHILRELTFRMIDQTMVRLGDLIPYLPQSTLTTLRLEVMQETIIRLDYILDRLPNLEQFSLSRISSRGPQACHLAVIPMMHPNATGQSLGESKHTRLRSLLLQEVMIASEVVEDLLLRSPRLEHLELVKVHPIPKPDPRSNTPVVNPPDMVTSYREGFNIISHASNVVIKEQRSAYRQEILEILKRCHQSFLSLTLRTLAFSVWDDNGGDSSLEVELMARYIGLTEEEGYGDNHGKEFGGRVNNWGLDPKHFQDCIKALSRRSEWMYLSALEYPLETEEEEDERVKRDGPRITPKGGLTPPGPQPYRPPLSSSLRTIPNTLTSLDLLRGHFGALGEYLHCYLCHSPNLRHLFAPEVTIGLDNFDIFEHYFQPAVTQRDRKEGWVEGTFNLNRLQKRFWLNHKPRTPSCQIKCPKVFEPSLQRKRVWACRGLESLQIQISVRGSNPTHHGGGRRVNKYGSTSDYGGGRSRFDKFDSVLYRILFGYLSTVVPKLRVLEVQSSFCRLSRDSGFCLLGKMRQLERLVLILNETWTDQVRQEDLSWLQRFQWPPWVAQQVHLVDISVDGRHVHMNKNMVLRREEELRAFLDTLPPFLSVNGSTTIGCCTVEEELWELGQMSQVERVLAEMELDDLLYILRRNEQQQGPESRHLDHLLDRRRWPRLQWIDVSLAYTRQQKLAEVGLAHPRRLRESAACPNMDKDPLQRYHRHQLNCGR